MDITPKYNPDDPIWFTSDTHFRHANIIKFSGRPFANVEEMNEELIRRWNEAVPDNGIVFHLGDFCCGNSKEWNDVDEMTTDAAELAGWYQIVGHTQQESDPVIREHFACLDCRRVFKLDADGRIVEIEGGE